MSATIAVGMAIHQGVVLEKFDYPAMGRARLGLYGL
jgi:hypothetical protein